MEHLSDEVVGAVPAVFIEVNAAHYEPVFPATSPAPAALPGRVVTKTRFDGRTPTPYVAPNRPHFNLHDSIAAGRGGGVFVRTDHMYANANFGFADPNYPANPNRGRGGRGGGAAPPPIGTINPNVPGGHLHPDNVEWWIVLTGQISAKFEAGHFIASEGDVLTPHPTCCTRWPTTGQGAPAGSRSAGTTRSTSTPSLRSSADGTYAAARQQCPPPHGRDRRFRDSKIASRRTRGGRAASAAQPHETRP